MSDKAQEYYEKTISESSDAELNARCLYMIAKCELNDFYNNGSNKALKVKVKYGILKLPEYESFKVLDQKYADTKFYKMIIKECSYFRHYTATLD